MDPSVENALSILEIATELEDEPNKSSEAASMYANACFIMEQCVSRMATKVASSCSDEDMATSKLLEEKIKHYRNRATLLIQSEPARREKSIVKTLKTSSLSNPISRVSISPTNKLVQSDNFHEKPSSADEIKIADMVGKANVFLARALDLDEKKSSKLESNPLKEYMMAAEIFLDALKMTENMEKKNMGQFSFVYSSKGIGTNIKGRLEGILGTPIFLLLLYLAIKLILCITCHQSNLQLLY